MEEETRTSRMDTSDVSGQMSDVRVQNGRRERREKLRIGVLGEKLVAE